MNCAQPSVRELGPTALLLSAAVLVAGCGMGSGLPGDGGGGGHVPPDSSALLETVGLVSAVGGDAQLLVRWSATDADGSPLAVALFRGVDHASVYQGTAVLRDVGDDQVLFTQQANGADAYFGLALDRGAGVFDPVGAVLHVRTGAPLYVDASSSSPAPDGTTPASAFRDPIDGVLTAFALGGGNVWIAAGTYADVALQLWPNVHVYGGFEPSFALATRDPAVHVTRLDGRAGAAICEVLGGDPGAVLDGCTLDGLGLAPIGIDIDTSAAELRSLAVANCTSRGLRLRSVALDHAVDVRIARCSVTANGAEGLSLAGAFDLRVEGSRFNGNSFEGISLSSLVAPDGVPVSLRVRDSVCSGNGQEGLDCKLAAPPTLGATGGVFDIEVEGSRFERNGVAGAVNSINGLNLDIDFDLVPGWHADIVVRGCTARGNRGAGVHLDLDSSSTAFVHRVLATSNGGNGLSVTSESTPGFATVSASAFVGNGGAGMSASGGNVPIVASHCIVAGNAGGGVVSSVLASSVASSVAWLQPGPWSGVETYFDVVASSELTPVFRRAPLEYRRALTSAGDALVLDDASTLSVGDRIEVEDDGVARVLSVLAANNQVQLDPNTSALAWPTLLARFSNGAGVVEDYALANSSSALGAGMPALDGSSVDAGPFGAPLGGDVGGESALRPALFRASACSPGVASTIATNSALAIRFSGGGLDALSVDAQAVRARDALGNPLAATFFEQLGLLIVQAPAGGWPAGKIVIEVHARLRATDGTPLATPVALPFEAQ